MLLFGIRFDDATNTMATPGPLPPYRDIIQGKLRLNLSPVAYDASARQTRRAYWLYTRLILAWHIEHADIPQADRSFEWHISGFRTSTPYSHQFYKEFRLADFR